MIGVCPRYLEEKPHASVVPLVDGVSFKRVVVPFALGHGGLLSPTNLISACLTQLVCALLPKNFN